MFIVLYIYLDSHRAAFKIVICTDSTNGYPLFYADLNMYKGFLFKYGSDIGTTYSCTVV